MDCSANQVILMHILVLTVGVHLDYYKYVKDEQSLDKSVTFGLVNNTTYLA